MAYDLHHQLAEIIEADPKSVENIIYTNILAALDALFVEENYEGFNKIMQTAPIGTKRNVYRDLAERVAGLPREEKYRTLRKEALISDLIESQTQGKEMVKLSEFREEVYRAPPQTEDPRDKYNNTFLRFEDFFY